jgi:hypothetical protein
MKRMRMQIDLRYEELAIEVAASIKLFTRLTEYGCISPEAIEVVHNATTDFSRQMLKESSNH